METIKAIFCWSGGKDSAYCLHKVQQEKKYDIRYLLTTVNNNFGRISMHGVREELLDLQAAAVGLPLLKVRVSEGSNEEYDRLMAETLLKVKSEGIEYVIFGDIFLEDLRLYRENNLAQIGMKAVFPLWKMDTAFLIRDFIGQQFKTLTCCTNDGYLGEEWAGREIDLDFVNQLPADTDPCGENGEFHSFCYDGPLFQHKIHFTIGEKIYRPIEVKTNDTCSLPSDHSTRGFWFCDLIPV